MNVNLEFKDPNNYNIKLKIPTHKKSIVDSVVKGVIKNEQARIGLNSILKDNHEARIWLYRGINLKRNKEYSGAKICFEKAHNKGSDEGSIYLAKLYKEGENGIEKNLKKAFELLVQPMKKMNVDAIILMAHLHLENPILFDNNNNKYIIFKLLHNVAQERIKIRDPRNEVLLLLISRCYSEGMGTDKNPDKANKYFLRSLQENVRKGSEERTTAL